MPSKIPKKYTRGLSKQRHTIDSLQIDGGVKRKLNEINVKRSLRPRISLLHRELLTNGTRIVDTVNSLNLFLPGTEVIFTLDDDGGDIYCKFRLFTKGYPIDDNYSSAVYMIETEGFNKGYRWGNALSVESRGFSWTFFILLTIVTIYSNRHP